MTISKDQQVTLDWFKLNNRPGYLLVKANFQLYTLNYLLLGLLIGLQVYLLFAQYLWKD